MTLVRHQARSSNSLLRGANDRLDWPFADGPLCVLLARKPKSHGVTDDHLVANVGDVWTRVAVSVDAMDSTQFKRRAACP
jgi:hypothetical protein